MKRLLIIFMLILPFGLSAQYSTFYHQRASLFEKLPIGKTDIVFLGNSLTNGGEWAELFDNKNIKNRGISSDVAKGVYNRLNPITKGEPEKIFLLIGINDLARGETPDSLIISIATIVDKIKKESPETKIHLQSILPVNASFGMFSSHTSKVEKIIETNELLKKLSKEKHVTYIDLYTQFVEPNTNELSPKYTNDGLHLLGEGYIHWRNIIKPYIQ